MTQDFKALPKVSIPDRTRAHVHAPPPRAEVQRDANDIDLHVLQDWQKSGRGLPGAGFLVVNGKAAVVFGCFVHVRRMDRSVHLARNRGLKGKVCYRESAVLHELLLGGTLLRHHMDTPLQQVVT